MKTYCEKRSWNRIGFAASMLAGCLGFGAGPAAADVQKTGWHDAGARWEWVTTDPGVIYAPKGEYVRFGDYWLPHWANPDSVGQWYYKFVQGTAVPCNGATFGGDPYPYRVKRCEVLRGWKYVAAENQWFNRQWGPLNGLYYGAFHFQGTSGSGDQYPFYMLADSHHPGGLFFCGNQNFGDPFPGMVKACFVRTDL